MAAGLTVALGQTFETRQTRNLFLIHLPCFSQDVLFLNLNLKNFHHFFVKTFISNVYSIMKGDEIISFDAVDIAGFCTAYFDTRCSLRSTIPSRLQHLPFPCSF